MITQINPTQSFYHLLVNKIPALSPKYKPIKLIINNFLSGKVYENKVIGQQFVCCDDDECGVKLRGMNL